MLKHLILVGAFGLNIAALNTAILPSDSCFYALGATDQRAFQLSGNSVLTSGCSVAVSSTNSEAFQMEGQSRVNLGNHARVAVVGGWQLNGNQIRDTIDNAQIQPISLSPAPSDPLASVVAPTTGTIINQNSVTYDQNNKPLNNIILPGVYCGGLKIQSANGITFTMNPGIYVMAGNGGFTVESQGKVAGTGVTIYTTTSAGWGCSQNSGANYGPIRISGQATVTLSAPTTGALAGILMLANKTACVSGSCQQHKIEGNSVATLNGALYFPKDSFLNSGQSTLNGSVMLVARTVKIEDSIWNNTLNPYIPIGVTVTPATVSLTSGQTQQFSAAVSNTGNSAVTWALAPTGVGTISVTGLYTAPASVTTSTTVTVTAKSAADQTKSGSATITLNPSVPVSVTVAPSTASLFAGQTKQFTATVGGTSNQNVTWSIPPGSLGST